MATIDTERFYRDPPADSKLAKPSVPPALPPISTATFMAQQAREEQEEALAALHPLPNPHEQPELDSGV